MMAHFYNFAIIRLAPQDARGERLNVGVAIFTENGIDIRKASSLNKVRAISKAVDAASLGNAISDLSRLDSILRDSGVTSDERRAANLKLFGPITLSKMGAFEANTTTEYEDRVSRILRVMVDPEQAKRKPPAKKSKLASQVKTFFKQERVLAGRDEDINSHRIVSGYELDEGLVADFALKNGAMHVVETVDATGGNESIRRAIGDVGIAALVLERARMRFGKDGTRSRLVYEASQEMEKIIRPSLDAAENQGAKLTNWASEDDRVTFIHSLASLATPAPRGGRRVRS